MSIISLNFPTTKEFLELTKEFDKTTPITDIILNGKISLPDITLDKSYYNILISENLFDIEEYDDRINMKLKEEIIDYIMECNINKKRIRFYVYPRYRDVIVIGNLPPIFTYFNINGKFDLNITLYNRFNSFAGFLCYYFKMDIILFIPEMNRSEELRYVSSTIDDENSLAIMKYGQFKKPEFQMPNNESDITLGDILPYINNITLNGDFLSSLETIIFYYLENSVGDVSLDKSKTNILVMCSNDDSIERNKYKTIVKAVLGEDIEFEKNDKVYHLGYDISKVKKPQINRCSIKNFTLKNDTKFDLIISEHCPYNAVFPSAREISDRLNDYGIFITPNYKRTSQEMEEIFSREFEQIGMYKKNSYVAYRKREK